MEDLYPFLEDVCLNRMVISHSSGNGVEDLRLINHRRRKGLITLAVMILVTWMPWPGYIGHIALADSSGDYEYTVASGEATIDGYTGPGGAIVIPKELGGAPVTSIGANAFQNKHITDLTFEEDAGITVIGDWAFHHNQLTSVAIPSRVINIGQAAFRENQLAAVTFSEDANLTSIGREAFTSNKLTEVTIPNGVTTIDINVFAFNQLTSVTLPDGLTSILDNAFTNNQLERVTIPNSVTTLGYGAFGHNLLTSVTIPSNITQIDDYAFNMNKLTHVTIPDNVTSMGYGAFANNQITSVTFPESLTRIGEFVFFNNLLTSLTIPNHITRIDEAAFRYNKLASLTLPNNGIAIGEAAFAQNLLTHVTIPPSVTNTGLYAFTENLLTSVTISEGVKVIGDYSFRRNALTSITIPDSVTTIGEAAFDENHLTSVFIPESVTTIGKWAFDINPQLDSVTIAGSPSFGDFVFQNASADLTLTGYNGSSVQTYAQANDHNFNNISFTPNGNTDWNNTASSQVWAFHRDANKSLDYVWTTSDALPDANAAWQPFNSGDTLAKNDADGDWYLHVRASGNIDGVLNEHSRFFRLDRTPPELDVTMLLEDHSPYMNGAWSNQSVTVSVYGNDALSGMDAMQLSRDGGHSWQDYTPGSKLVIEESGAYHLQFLASDKAGNTHTELRTVNISKSGLMLTSAFKHMDDTPYASGDWTRDSVVASVYANNMHGATVTSVTYSWDEGVTWEPYNAPLLLDAEGQFPLWFQAEDATGTRMTEKTVILIDRTAPTVHFAPNGKRSSSRVASSAVTISDADSGVDESTLYYIWTTSDTAPDEDADWQPFINGDTLKKTIRAGSSYLHIRAADLVGNAILAHSLPFRYVESGNSDAADIISSTDGSITIPVGRSGDVSLGDGITISIPIGAAEQELRITIEKLLDTANLPKPNELVSDIYELTYNMTGNFNKPVTLSIQLDSSQIGDQHSAAIFYFDETSHSWVMIGGVVDGDWITAEVEHFTKFAVMAIEKPDQPVPTFTDIAGHWANSFIAEAVSKQFVSGYPDNTFRPNALITRAEFTVMMVNALKLDGGDQALSFIDEDQIGAWAKQAIAQAAHAGIIDGYADGSFRPAANITRAEMASMIARAPGITVHSEAETDFADDGDIPKWAKGAIEAIQKLGIISGRGDHKFVPNDPATRAEAVVVMLETLKYFTSD